MTDKAIDVAKDREKDEILSELWKRSEELHTDKWKEEWHRFCVEHYDGYKNAICGYVKNDYLDKTQLFSHYLDCEAHTDVWRELFPTWNLTNETDN